MTRLPESSLWEEEIELISRSERVSGGLDGVANRPLKSLANRTRFLKQQAGELDQLIAEKISAVKTFSEGATLESPRDEILYGVFRLVWTGAFPKSVPAYSSPKTTGGVGAGAWAYTSDAVIRQNLASNDGLKWIGKCKDLSTLRTIEPTISGQSIILERAVVGGPLLNVILTNNPAASDAVDDGYSRFVTAGGAVWDADISFGHNVFLAGYSDELNNLADCLNMIIQDKVNKVISRGYVAGGVDAEIRIPPNPNAEGVTDFYMNKKSVKIPSFLRVHSAPAAIYDYSDFTTG
ncbi:hypothetical protein ACP71T_18630, partial [Klebsiella pneumoniae]